MTGTRRPLAVLAVLIGATSAGLFAYYARGGAGALSNDAGNELRYLPANCAMVVHADVRKLMASEVGPRVWRASAGTEDAGRQLLARAGVDLDGDIEHVLACVQSSGSAGELEPEVALARGRFDEGAIESKLMARGARRQDGGVRRFVLDDRKLALAFVEPGLLAFGSAQAIQSALDRASGQENAAGNADLTARIRASEGDDLWMVGRYDAIRPNAVLPGGLAGTLLPITWLSVGGRVGATFDATIRAEAPDEAGAANLRGTMQTVIGLARVQAGRHPEYQAFTQSLRLSGQGSTVTLSFSLAPAMIDVLGDMRAKP